MRRWLSALALVLVASQALSGEWGMPASIQEVKAKHSDELMAQPGVVSVGIGKDAEGNPAIIVGLDRARPETEAEIPDSLEGYPVVTRVIGPIRAQ